MGRHGLLAAAMFFMLAGCNGAGTFTEIYINELNAGQKLELTTKRAPIRSLFNGALADAPGGSYVLVRDDEVSTGTYTKNGTTYVLLRWPGMERKFKAESDASLRDETGTYWRLQTRTHTFR